MSESLHSSSDKNNHVLRTPYHWVNFIEPLIDLGLKLQLVFRMNPITP